MQMLAWQRVHSAALHDIFYCFFKGKNFWYHDIKCQHSTQKKTPSGPISIRDFKKWEDERSCLCPKQYAPLMIKQPTLWKLKQFLVIDEMQPYSKLNWYPIKQSIYSPAVSELRNTCPKWHVQNISKTEWIRVFSIVCSSSSQLSICLFFFFQPVHFSKFLPSCWYLIIKQLFSSVSVIDCLARNLS